MSLATPELESTQEFYSAVLGWTFRPDSLGEQFSVAMSGGSPVAGLGAVTSSLGMAVAWTPYFFVTSADTVAARIGERSATVAVGPVELGNGRACLASDPAGANFGFWEGDVRPGWRSGDHDAPAQLDLRTRDAFASAIFYAEVFEWASGRPDRCDVEYEHGAVIVRAAGRTVATLRGGAVESAPDPRIRPRWHVCFRVEDVGAAVAAAEAAGGTVTEPPTDTPFGYAAGLRDPDGGLFTVAATQPSHADATNKPQQTTT
ncbi:VOC family protein [Streptomyces armeniacus]|uniref:VOC family protein n=1 Tax=Streptomyces armeniacus TaxID=83291 RepID=UPI001FE58E05|nr:VOC family protein [Streptomyces armeniacus]